MSMWFQFGETQVIIYVLWNVTNAEKIFEFGHETAVVLKTED